MMCIRLNCYPCPIATRLRPKVAETEAPRPQPVPQTLRQRHLAMFRTAQHMNHYRRVIGRAEGGVESDDDDDDVIGSHSERGLAWMGLGGSHLDIQSFS